MRVVRPRRVVWFPVLVACATMTAIAMVVADAADAAAVHVFGYEKTKKGSLNFSRSPPPRFHASAS